MIINGTDLSTVGWKPARGRQLPRLGGEQTRAVNIPSGMGGVRLGGDLHPAAMIIPGQVRAATATALRANVDALAALLQGELVVRLPDFPDREWVGRLQQASGLSEVGPDYASTAADVRLEFQLLAPTARARAETSRAGSGTIALGSAPSPIRVEAGSVGALTIRVRAGGSGGTILRELVWAGGGGAVVVDTETFSVTAGGANAIDGLTAASEFPIADPAEGANYLEVSSGTGFYRKRWY